MGRLKKLKKDFRKALLRLKEAVERAELEKNFQITLSLETLPFRDLSSLLR